jgi:hypothetical protein
MNAQNAHQLATHIWNDPVRTTECTRYYEAVISTLNETHQPDMTQDSLALFEAIAMVIGQLTGSLDERAADGSVNFIAARASFFRTEFIASGKAARHFVEDMN